MISDLEKLQAEGGPFPIMKHIGYGNAYLVVTTTVNNDGPGTVYNIATITFENAAGQFGGGGITLYPQHLKDTEVISHAAMNLNVINIHMTLPIKDEQNGEVYLECTFTDIDGQGNFQFKSPIAEWTAIGPIKP